MKTKKDRMVPFSTSLTCETKKLLERFSKTRGIKINHLVEEAILEYIEDEMDNAIIAERELEEVVKWKRHA